MAGRSFRRLGTGGWAPGRTQGAYRPQSKRFFFAAFAAFAFLTRLTAQQPDRARTEALARRATERLQALQRVGQSTRTVAALAKLDRDRIASHARTLDDLKRARKALEARRAELAVLRGATEKAQAAAQRAEQAKNDLIRDIDRKRDLNAQ